jgi:hypothetical protein
MLSPGQTSISGTEMAEVEERKALSMSDKIKAKIEMVEIA